MSREENVFFLAAGLGYPRVDEFLEKYPDRAFNTEASEQTALDMAVGLAYAGKIPVVYTITPFYYRAWETLRTYFDHEKLSCILIGAGVGEEYGEHDGFSHSASDIKDMLSVLKNFKQYYPDSKIELEGALDRSLEDRLPTFINIHR